MVSGTKLLRLRGRSQGADTTSGNPAPDDAGTLGGMCKHTSLEQWARPRLRRLCPVLLRGRSCQAWQRLDIGFILQVSRTKLLRLRWRSQGSDTTPATPPPTTQAP